jgi:GT2 family glycosyltransferase
VKVSVLVHNRDRAELVNRCLESLSVQTHRPLEVIIHDASSTDGSRDVIRTWQERLSAAGIEVHVATVPLTGVATSRNRLAESASGDLLFFLDNDARLGDPTSIERAVGPFLTDDKLAVLSGRVVLADGPGPDPMAWVYRRPLATWWSRPFETFTFAGAAFCVRVAPFRSAGGFWEALPYAREEEELAYALLDAGWELRYDPSIVVHHYPTPVGRLSIDQRRFVELRNGLNVQWRRLPISIAVPAMLARIASMSLRARRERQSLRDLLRAVPAARRMWQEARSTRAPIRCRTVVHLTRLHLRST